jgi:hypothetical protein
MYPLVRVPTRRELEACRLAALGVCPSMCVCGHVRVNGGGAAIASDMMCHMHTGGDCVLSVGCVQKRTVVATTRPCWLTDG